MRILQISDTHLSGTHAHFSENARATAAWLAAQPAELVVHTGDLSMNGAIQADELAHAAAWNATLPVEMRSVPGNHDVGDHRTINPAQAVDDNRLAQWRANLGPDRWAEDRGGWRLIGLNAMLLGTGHREEENQFDWLAQALRTDAPIAVFLHKPLFIDHPEEGPRGYWTVAPVPRARLMGLISAAPVWLVASGHLHIHRQINHAGIDHVWCPAASFVCGDSQEDLGGTRRLGVIEHLFGPDRVVSRFIRPVGLVDLPIEPVSHIVYPRPTVAEPAQ